MGDELERTWLQPPSDDGKPSPHDKTEVQPDLSESGSPSGAGKGSSGQDASNSGAGSSGGEAGPDGEDGTDPTILLPEDQRGASPKVSALQDPSLPKIPDVAVTSIIGRGGMGVVYRGTQSYLDREVAVKLMSTEGTSDAFAARFQREAKLLAGMTHTNIVSCYQAGVTGDNHCYIVMEFIDGPDLGQWVRKNGALPVLDAIAVCRDLAAALDHGYESGIIHRDVKPANVLLCPRSKGTGEHFPFIVKLADLGLARTESRGPEQAEITLAGSILGTPSTMAPEQFDDPDHVDFRADIYGLGCILYYALTGEAAFPPAALTKLITMKQSEIPDPRKLNSEIPESVARLVMDLLAADRDARPASYGDLLRRCDEIHFELGPTPKPARRWLMGAAMLLGVVATIVGVIAYQFRDQPPSLELAAPSSPVSEGDEVRIVASGADPEGVELIYQWTQLPVGDEPAIEISNPDGTELDFTAPQGIRDYVLRFEVRVRDGEGRPDVIETLDIPVTAVDDPPVVEIKPNHSFFEDTSISIAPTRVVDPEGSTLTFLWSQDETVDGPRVELIEPASRELRFDAPEDTADYKLKFWLEVQDGPEGPGHRTAVVVDVTSDNDLPLITLEGPDSVREGEAFTLTGSAKDPEGAEIQLQWRQIDGPVLRFSPEISSARAEFTAPHCATPSKIVIELEANDGERTATARKAIQINAAPGLEAPEPGTQTDMFLQDPGTMGKRLVRWTAMDDRGTWGDAEHPGAAGLCLDGETSQAFDLPHGTWFITGRIEPMGENLPSKLGYRLLLGCDLALSLTLVRSGDGYVAGLRRLRLDEAGEWIADAELVEPVRGGWSRDVALGFAIARTVDSVRILWGEVGAESSLGDYTAEVTTPLRPTQLQITVERGIACFCEFYLTGK